MYESLKPIHFACFRSKPKRINKLPSTNGPPAAITAKIRLFPAVTTPNIEKTMPTPNANQTPILTLIQVNKTLITVSNVRMSIPIDSMSLLMGSFSNSPPIMINR